MISSAFVLDCRDYDEHLSGLGEELFFGLDTPGDVKTLSCPTNRKLNSMCRHEHTGGSYIAGCILMRIGGGL